VIAGLFILGMGFGGRGFLNPSAIAIFCQALIGLAVASSMGGYEPLPVTNAFLQRKQIFQQVMLMVLITIIAGVVSQLVGSVGLTIGQQLFREPYPYGQLVASVSLNKWLCFFIFFGGGGIGEETPYRLVLLSLIWKVSKRRWLAVVLSALVFAAYHLSPLNSLYRNFWQFPISQFLASVLTGLVWGYVYVKRGYETAVLGHTLADWVPMMLFIG
jgi:membrane protease YdiL (CAAX protease family)